MEETPELQHSLARRNIYLDPLNHIQVALLERYRQGATPEDREQVAGPPATVHQRHRRRGAQHRVQA